MDKERATATSAAMTPSLRAATATRVWQRQSMEWMAAVLAAEPTAMPRSMSRRLQVGPANSRLAESSLRALVFVEEFGAGGVAAGPAVVVGWIPVGDPDEQDGVDRLGHLGVTEPDVLPPFLAPRSQPGGQLTAGRGVVNDDGLGEVVFAGQEQLPAGFGGGDGGGGHELGDLDDCVASEGLVVEPGHAGTGSGCLADHA
jgi:hypothetical protein